MLKVVHAVPDWSWRGTIPGHGAWKDISGRLGLWKDLGLEADVVDVDVNRPASLLDRLPADATDLFFEFTHWPELLEGARRTRPRLRIHVRAHGVGALAALRRLRGSWPGARPWAKLALGAANELARDARVVATADTLLGISEWDARHYWRRFPRRATVETMPYFCPWTGEPFRTSAPLWSERRKAVACMPAARSPLDSAQIDAFFAFAGTAARSPSGKGLEFLLTNALARENPDVDVPAGVEAVGDVGDPFLFLQRVRAVAVLAQQGFGAKTTVYDAIEAGCHVLVGGDLVGRLPSEVRARCIVVDALEEREVERAFEALELPPPPSNLNYRYRERAKQVLRLCLTGVSRGSVASEERAAGPVVEEVRIVEPGLGITSFGFRSAGTSAVHVPWTKGGASVLMYHGIVEPKRDDILDRYAIDTATFRSHLRFLKRQREPVRLSTLVECLASGKAPDPRWVVVTLDDALRSQVGRGAELLAEAAVPWTLCAPIGLVGTRSTLWSYALALLVLECWKGRRIGLPGGGSLPVGGRRSRESALRRIRALLQPSPCGLDPVDYVRERIEDFGREEFEARISEDGRFAMATWDDLRALRDLGVEIVAHGYAHLPHDDGTADDRREEETGQARAKAESELGRCVGYALPHGISASWTRERLAAAGFEFGLTSRPEAVFGGTDLMDLPRLHADVPLEALSAAVTSTL